MSESGGGLRIGDFFLRLWIWCFAPREKEPDLVEKWEAALPPPRQDLTDPSIPKVKVSNPVTDLGLRDAARVTWDDITQFVPEFAFEAARPTATVTRPRVPREEIASHVAKGKSYYDHIGRQRSSDHRPRHSAPPSNEPGEGERGPRHAARVGATHGGGSPASRGVSRKRVKRKRR